MGKLYTVREQIEHNSQDHWGPVLSGFDVKIHHDALIHIKPSTRKSGKESPERNHQKMTPEQERELQELDVEIQIAEKRLRILGIRKQIAETELEILELQHSLKEQLREENHVKAMRA